MNTSAFPTPAAEIRTSESPDATMVVRLEEMAKTHIEQIGELKDEIKKHTEILNDIFINDSTYSQHAETAKEASRIKTATKNQLMKLPQAAELSEKIKSLKSEKRELEGGLSDYLKEYKRVSGATQLELFDGSLVDIVETNKIKKSFNKNG